MNLILNTKTLDDKNAVHGEKSDFLGQLTEKIRGCGVSFYIWTKKGTQDELDWSSLTGSDSVMFSAYHEYGKHPRLCHVVPLVFMDPTPWTGLIT
jgi:hypothetical protein